MKQNKELASEELDRELVLTHQKMTMSNGTVHEKLIKVKVSKKAFNLNDNYGKAQITFAKSVNYGLKITTKREDIKYQQCSLGHNHEIKGQTHTYDFFTLPEHTIEDFIEWLQSGEWKGTQKVESVEHKVLRECFTLLKAIKTDDTLVKAGISKMKARITDILNLKGYQDVR